LAQQVPKGPLQLLLAQQGPKVSQVLQGHKVFKVKLDHKVHKVQQVLKVLKELQVLKAKLGQQAQQGLKA
jgi:hypothetical protein